MVVLTRFTLGVLYAFDGHFYKKSLPPHPPGHLIIC